jgi:general secretion pathway protein N
MTSRYALLALGLGVYLAVAIVRFPASVAYRWFAPDDFVLAAIDGTIWRGSAAYGSVTGLYFQNMRWQLRPVALLTGKIHATVETDLAGGFAQADVLASSGRIVLTDVSASTNLSAFRSMLPLGDIGGQVSISFNRLELVDGWPLGAVGEVRIADLAVPPLFPVPGVVRVELGNFVARFTESEAPGITAVVDDQGGPIELTGRLNLAPDRSYEIDTLFRARADAPAHLVEGIALLPVSPNADGMREFRLADRL